MDQPGVQAGSSSAPSPAAPGSGVPGTPTSVAGGMPAATPTVPSDPGNGSTMPSATPPAAGGAQSEPMPVASGAPNGAGGGAGSPDVDEGASGAGGSTEMTEGAGGAAAPGAAGTSNGGGGDSSNAGTGGASEEPGGGGTPNAGGSTGDSPVLDRPARVLLYTFSTLDIPSVPAQLSILGAQLQSWGYEVDESEDPGMFTDDNLANYAAVGMINTCFSPFGNNSDGQSEAEALQRFLQEGGGLFGTHCADVTFQSANPPALYNQLLGGRASSQNFEGSNDCRKMADHPTTADLPDTFEYVGNLDGTDFIADDSTVLVNCTWGNGTDVAVSWVRNEGLGRVFFSNFGKVDSDLTNATIGDAHLLAGLGWVLGLSGL